MKPEDPLKQMLEQTRRVYRSTPPPRSDGPPNGFMEKLQTKRGSIKPALPTWHLWERVSWAGAAATLAFAGFLHWNPPPSAEELVQGLATDPWMAMPMNEEFGR